MVAALWGVALILALAPGLGLLWYIRRLDRYEPEPWSAVGRAFLAGCISVVPALVIEALYPPASPGFLGTVWKAFIVVALTEELCKGGLAFGFMWRRREFNEVMDGIVYFGVAHMGFAVMENLGYVLLNADGNVVQALMTAFARTTTAVPLHVISGMIMGYHMGVAKFATHWREKARHFGEALFLPVLLHGIYDVAAFNQDSSNITTMSELFSVGFGTALMYAAVAALWLFLMPRVKKAQEASPWRPAEGPTLPVAPEACTHCGSAYPAGANYCHKCAAPVGQTSAYYRQAQAPGLQQ